MKHRWLFGLLLVLALAAPACTPAEGDAVEQSPTPAQADFYDDY